MSGRLLAVLRSLSEAELGTVRPVEVFGEKMIPVIDRGPRKLLNTASLLVNLAPLKSKLKTFNRLSVEERREWLERLSPESLISDLIGMFEFLLLAAYYTDEGEAGKIGYRRSNRLPPVTECRHVELSASKGPGESYDVVVVGSGAGGAVVAWSLSREGYRVAVFEAGPEPRLEELYGEHPVYRALKYYWDSGLTFTWGVPSISLPFGRVLGGTVTVNSGTMFRVPEDALAEWRRETGVNIGLDELGEAYRIVEERLNVKPVPEALLGGNAMVMRRGAESLGLSHGPVRRPISGCRGLGECAFGCPCGGKVDMRLGFLREAVENGAEIYTGAVVEKILVGNGRAVGVVVRLGNVSRRIAARAVVVSAGALNTPRLLKKSGVGSRSLGRHLHIHPAAGVSAVMPEAIYGWRGTMQSYYVDDLLEEHHTLLLATFPPPGIGYSAASLPIGELANYPRLASIGVQTSDSCVGNVFGFRLFGVARYNLCTNDLEKVKAGIRLSAEILFAAGAEKVYPPLKRGRGVRSLSELDRLLESTGPRGYKLSAYHPMSTARMASDPDAGVVDGGGRVYGVENLYVADASVLPSTTRVNPQLTINAIALIISRSISRDLGGPR
ncbi:MAG: GMC family oxidoreductase [Desulfurococcales archaeon]|nr:GMC family oxidoreductase [Desulfurococcales archaeon]